MTDNAITTKGKGLTQDRFLSVFDRYLNGGNAATSSKFDANANVESKNIATLIGELPKASMIELNRDLLYRRIKQMYGEEVAGDYLYFLNHHYIYKNDETSIANYCASITMYPFLLNGTKDLGGKSGAPKNLKAFCGGFVNLVFMVSSMLSGACATPEFLMYFDYFARKEYGEDYYKRADEVVDLSVHHRTLDKTLCDYFEQVVYTLNQPAGTRNYQSVFWNIAYYDKPYFESLFGNFYFPDGTQPVWESLSWLQRRFMKWFNAERTRCVLTFPVETMALLYDADKKFVDQDTADFTAEMYSEGHSFFTYMSDNADSLSSCCFEGGEVIKVFRGGQSYYMSVSDFVNSMTDKEDTYGEHLDTGATITAYNLQGEEKQVEITGVLKKKYTGKMYKFVTDKGEICVTADHPLMVRDKDGKVSEVAAEVVANNIDDYELATAGGIEVNFIPTQKVEATEVTDKVVYDIELAEQHYFSANNIITHNCRLRNEIKDNGFSYTLGAGGVSTGSKSVLTININRCVQHSVRNNFSYVEFLTNLTNLCHKVQIAYNENLKMLKDAGMLPLFDAGFIDMSRQYLTIGVNGLVEAAEFLKIPVNDNPEYEAFVSRILGVIERANNEYKTKDLLFNCEMIPAENVGVKHAKWDKEDGYEAPRDCYNSYFYAVEDDSLSVIDHFRLHGERYIKSLTGGSALHMNLSEHLTKEQYASLMNTAAMYGCNYFTFNIPNTECRDCGHIDKRYLKECPVCGSKNVDYLTRIIGYLKRVSNFSAARQKEAEKRKYFKV